MVRPAALTSRPSLLLTSLAGAVATLLLSALLFLGPVFGIPFVGIPHLVGGLFTEDAAAAFWLGFWIFFLGGWIVFPVFFALFWPMLPGENEVTFTHGLVKGLVWGGILWILSGVLLPVLGWLNQLEGLESPGLFALGAGVLAALGVLLGHLAYGAALGLVSAMGREISPLDVMGKYDYKASGLNRAAASGNR
jgi:hypothetical protein